jgi:nicotinamidase/pyrazinamidase
LVVCGQALSHCVNFTVRDITNRLIENGQSPSIIYLLTDASSPVMGFEKAGEDFVHDMKESGVHITTTKEFDRLLENQA